jgi:glycopeptide antibiotics resistance protein
MPRLPKRLPQRLLVPSCLAQGLLILALLVTLLLLAFISSQAAIVVATGLGAVLLAVIKQTLKRR